MSEPNTIDRIHPDLRSLAHPIAELNEDPKNANSHPEANRLAIAEAFTRFGQRKPIVVRRDGMIVEAGNGTLQVLRAAGWTHLAVVVCDDDEATATAFAIADNKSAKLSKWNFEQLGANLQELLDAEYDFEGLKLWPNDELTELLEGRDPEQSDEEREQATEVDEGAQIPAKPEDELEEVEPPPPPPEPVTKSGEVFSVGRATVHCRDCMDVMAEMEDNSLDAIVCDPPYGLSPDGKARTWDDIADMRAGRAGFFGASWDAAVPGVKWARECLRVLKPGGHLIAQSATRTYHRLACAVEDAGFGIRDMPTWFHGMGHPKATDIGRTIDRFKFDREEILQVTAWIASARDAAGLKNRDIDEAFGFAGMAGHWTSKKSQPSVPTLEQVPLLLELFKTQPPPEIQRLILDLNSAKGEPGPNWLDRPVVGQEWMPDSKRGARVGFAGATYCGEDAGNKALVDITTAATDEAKKWEGWSTQLAPSHEPCVLARKPLDRGGIARNVVQWGTGALHINAGRIPTGDPAWPLAGVSSHPMGRWPGNLYRASKPSPRERSEGLESVPFRHVTVKPLKWMKWLVALVTPPGGLVYDPFGGSGTTGVAALELGFDVVLSELDPGHCDIIRGRLAHAVAKVEQSSEPKRRAPARDGDKDQARQRVNYLVRQGSLANPNTVECADCGHVGDDRRHEYDHYLGYDGEHHEDVEAVCSTCHHAREKVRREHA